MRLLKSFSVSRVYSTVDLAKSDSFLGTGLFACGILQKTAVNVNHAEKLVQSLGRGGNWTLFTANRFSGFGRMPAEEMMCPRNSTYVNPKGYLERLMMNPYCCKRWNRIVRCFISSSWTLDATKMSLV